MKNACCTENLWKSGFCSSVSNLQDGVQEKFGWSNMDKMCLLKVSQAAEVSLLYLVLLVENLSVFNLLFRISFFGCEEFSGKEWLGFQWWQSLSYVRWDARNCHQDSVLIQFLLPPNSGWSNDPVSPHPFLAPKHCLNILTQISHSLCSWEMQET